MKIMPYPLYLSGGFQSIFLKGRARGDGHEAEAGRRKKGQFTGTAIGLRRAPKAHYKSPVDRFYFIVTLSSGDGGGGTEGEDELSREPAARCSSGYYVGSAINVSVSGFIPARWSVSRDHHIGRATCARDLLSSLPRLDERYPTNLV